MSDSWYKVDNVAKVFLATASQRDPRVFRISCTLNEEIDPDTLNEALRSTAQEWPQFQVTLHRGLFWHYFESTDQLPTAQPETKAPCAPLYTPERRNKLIYRVTYFGARINLEMFHAITDGNGGLLETMEAKPKSFALLYQVEGDANNARYVFYKVDAKRPTGEHNTTTESTEVDDTSMEITMTGKQFTIGAETKTCVKNRVLNDTTGATAYASFFTAVMEPKAAA